MDVFKNGGSKATQFCPFAERKYDKPMDLGVPFLMTIFVFGEDLLTEEETFLHVYESSQWQMFLVSFAWSSVGISLRLQYLEQLPVTESMDHALLIVSWQLEMVFTCLL